MTTEAKVGTESIEKCLELGAKNFALGLKIAEGGLNKDDIIYATEAFNNIKELVEFIASKPEVVAEFKDIDPIEGLALLKKVYDLYVAVKEESKVAE